jgi:(2Fe-2S) ferredoxin
LANLEKRNIDAVVTQTGCMGYCYAEPTIEVRLPGQDPVVYGLSTLRRQTRLLKNISSRVSWLTASSRLIMKLLIKNYSGGI